MVFFILGALVSFLNQLALLSGFRDFSGPCLTLPLVFSPYWLHPEYGRDDTITSRLRSAAIYRRPVTRTKRFTSSVQYCPLGNALLQYIPGFVLALVRFGYVYFVVFRVI